MNPLWECLVLANIHKRMMGEQRGEEIQKIGKKQRQAHIKRRARNKQAKNSRRKNRTLKGRKMFLYLISQDILESVDVYESAVVVAATEEEARGIHPSKEEDWNKRDSDTWVDARDVKVQCVGVAASRLKAGSVIWASYING